MEQDFDNTQKLINDNGIELEARDVYLAYIAKALCIIADRMSEEERRFYGIKIPKDKQPPSFIPTEEEAEEIFGIKGLMKMSEEEESN